MSTKLAQKPRLPKARTPSQVRADARALAGGQRLALAAAGDDDESGAPAPDGTTVGELWLYGLVGGYWWGFNAESVARALRGMDVDVLYVRIHSPGGSAPDGVAIANLLRNHRARVVVVVDGLAASAASCIAVAGEEVVMCPGSQMMLHDASTGMWGNAAELRRAADWIDKQSENYSGVYAYRAGGTPAEWRQVMLANDGWGTWYTADEAVDAGLADSVGTRPAAGSPPTAPEDQDDDWDDDMLARVAHDLLLLEQQVGPAARAAWQGERPKPPAASASGNTHTEGGSAVAFSDEQLTTMRQKLGIAEDADEATILAALDEALDERAESTADNTPGQNAGGQVPEGSVVVSKAEWDEMRGDAQRGAQAATRLHEREREAVLHQYRDRYLPENKASWASEYDRNPQATTEALKKRPVVIPLDELGYDANSDGPTPPSDTLAAVQADEGFQSWKVS